MRLKPFAVAMSLYGIAFVDAAAQGPTSAQGPTDQITVGQGSAVRWQAPRPFKDIVQGNDSLLTITAGPTDRDLVLTGKGVGTTNILIFDRDGNLMSNLIVSVGPPVNLTRVYSKLGNLHAYWAYSCNGLRCVKIKDEAEGYERLPSGPQSNVPNIVPGPGVAYPPQ
jgi:hypothetical protein